MGKGLSQFLLFVMLLAPEGESRAREGDPTLPINSPP